MRTSPGLQKCLLAALLLCLPASSSGSLLTNSQLFPAEMEPSVFGVTATTVASSPRKVAASSRSPVGIHNIRVRAYADYTRVVFDLQRPITFTQSRRKQPDRAIIDLKNSTLQRRAKSRLNDKTFPEEVGVSQPGTRTVRVSIDLERIQDYKLLPLKNPPRLVVDVFTKQNGSEETQVIELPSAQVRPEIKTIVIDPGHGGKDPGAVGRRGTREKEVTLKIANHLRNLITKRLQKKVLMTRNRDVFVELEDRADLANKQDADLFVSIHVNSHKKRGVKGLEVYHFGEASDTRALEVAARENGTPIETTGVGWEYLVADLLSTKKVEDSLELAWTTRRAMVKHLNGRYKVQDLGVKTAPFYVLRFTAMPSILAEIGFISNPAEEKLMRTAAYQQRMAEAIFRGIKTYVDSVETVSR